MSSLGDDLPERALLAAIVDATDDAVLSVDAMGRITSWNRGACDVYGHEANDAVGRPFSMVVPGGDASALLLAVLDGQVVAHTEVVRIRADGTEITVGETVSPLRTADGEIVGAAVVARDVTARRRLAQELDETRNELEERNRRLERSNRDLEQFAYIASHDLSEPLRSVAGMVTLLARRYQGRLDADADEFIAFAVDGCARMKTMIDDLLTYSRTGRVELRNDSVELAALVADVQGALRGQLEEAGAQLEVAPLPTVRGDRGQLFVVLQNLLSNAVKFRRPDVPLRIRISAEHRDTTVRVAVTDNGIGVPPEYRQRVFQMFQRLHLREQYPGSGIGLAISERIVERHGGEIGIDAAPEGGASFWFTLPSEVEAA